MSSKSMRSSISPFRSRKASAPPAPRAGARPMTPSSSSSSSRPTTPSSLPAARPTTPSSTASRPAYLSKPSSVSPVSPPSSHPPERPDFAKSKENVTVTVRFRPLSAREINKGDEIAWYADGDYIVRNEYNPSIAYGFDEPLVEVRLLEQVFVVESSSQRALGFKCKRYWNSKGKETEGGSTPKKNMTNRKKKDQRFGRKKDKAKMKCYNCGTLGHFARECSEQKKTQEPQTM